MRGNEHILIIFGCAIILVLGIWYAHHTHHCNGNNCQWFWCENFNTTNTTTTINN